jgi:four helix bundle protein
MSRNLIRGAANGLHRSALHNYLGNMPVASKNESVRKGPRHEGLKSWAACHQLVLSIYRVTSGWPSRELYGLTSQARRAAYSAAANIAEGSAKRGVREFRRFLNIAIGSISELTYILVLARDLGYVKPEVWGEMEAMRDHAGRLTWGLYRSLECKPTPGPAVPKI